SRYTAPPETPDLTHYLRLSKLAGTLGLDRLHLRRFHEAMTGAANFLDATDTMLRVEIDMRMEIEAAFAPDLDDERW
ncbi:hypothetical protein, partial [Frankia sp. R82]|uniref:hypothetical protein n=1 Tax=Frankia sp. R82 TaxID=2950553 RepID=UPI00204311DC